ncbi:MAG: hypothetical protein R3Y12_01530 [Clostridia bacterium]
MNIVLGELKKLIVPSFILAFITFALFAFNGYGSIGVFITIIMSVLYNFVNFFMLGSAISLALTKSPSGAQMYMAMQFFIRYIITGSLVYYSIILPSINALAFVIPLFYPKVILVLRSIKSN